MRYSQGPKLLGLAAGEWATGGGGSPGAVPIGHQHHASPGINGTVRRLFDCDSEAESARALYLMAPQTPAPAAGGLRVPSPDGGAAGSTF